MEMTAMEKWARYNAGMFFERDPQDLLNGLAAAIIQDAQEASQIAAQDARCTCGHGENVVGSTGSGIEDYRITTKKNYPRGAIERIVRRLVGDEQDD